MKMRHILLVALFIIGNIALGQTTFTIVADKENNICQGETVSLTITPTPAPGLWEIEWSPIESDERKVYVTPTETTLYKAKLTNQSTTEEVELEYEVVLKEKANVSLISVAKTCQYNIPFDESLISDQDDQYHEAEVKVNNEDGQAYTYYWQYRKDGTLFDINTLPGERIHLDGLNDTPEVTRAFALPANLDVVVRASVGDNTCSEASIITEVQKAGDVTISADPEKEVYLQNPVANFSFEDNDSDNPTSAWIWKFTNTNTEISDTTLLAAPEYTFKTKVPADYSIQLLTINQYRCDTTFYYPSRETLYPVKPVKLLVPNYLIQGTKWEIAMDNSGGDNPDPNGRNNNGNQKTYKVGEGDEVLPINTYYQSCDLLVFDRWGRKVFESTDYQNDWTGDDIKSGVYYFVLRCKGYSRNDEYKGSVTLFVK